MDILDILLDILLKPPQPLMGLFFWAFVVLLSGWHNQKNNNMNLIHVPETWV